MTELIYTEKEIDLLEDEVKYLIKGETGHYTAIFLMPKWVHDLVEDEVDGIVERFAEELYKKVDFAEKVEGGFFDW